MYEDNISRLIDNYAIPRVWYIMAYYGTLLYVIIRYYTLVRLLHGFICYKISFVNNQL